MKDEILWRWQTTTDTAEAIAADLGTTKSVVLGIVHRARQKGDVRASMRRAPTRMRILNRLVSLEAEIVRLRQMVAQ